MNSCTCKWQRRRGVSENEEKPHYMEEIMDAIATGSRGFPLSLCFSLFEHWFVSMNGRSEWFLSRTGFATHSTCSVSPKRLWHRQTSVNGVRHSATRRATDARWQLRRWSTGVSVSKKYVSDAALNNTEIFKMYLFISFITRHLIINKMETVFSWNLYNDLITIKS